MSLDTIPIGDAVSIPLTFAIAWKESKAVFNGHAQLIMPADVGFLELFQVRTDEVLLQFRLGLQVLAHFMAHANRDAGVLQGVGQLVDQPGIEFERAWTGGWEGQSWTSQRR